MRWKILAAIALCSGSVKVMATEMIDVPSVKNNLEIVFFPGKCTDRLDLKIYGPKLETVAVTSAPCDKNVKKFTFPTTTFVGSNGIGFLEGVYFSDDPVTTGRKTIKIKDAYWTYGPTFSGPVWTDGYERVVVVPEPAVWAMMIAGFGLVGTVARRRRLVSARS